MRTKSFRTAASAIAILALLTGAAQAKGKTFGLIQYNQQVSFFTDITKGAQKAAEEAGDKLDVFDANNSASAQDNAFETYIQQKVDGIIIVAVDPDGIAAAIRSADKAGIPVATVDRHAAGRSPEGRDLRRQRTCRQRDGGVLSRLCEEECGRQGFARHRGSVELEPAALAAKGL